MHDDLCLGVRFPCAIIAAFQIGSVEFFLETFDFTMNKNPWIGLSIQAFNTNSDH
jgi:hypothetical protein